MKKDITTADLNAEAASLTPAAHDAAFVEAAVNEFGARALDAEQQYRIERQEQLLAEAKRNEEAAKASGDDRRAECFRRMRNMRENELAHTRRCRDAVRPFVRRERIRQANTGQPNPAVRSGSAAPRPRERRETHVARATSSCDGGDGSGPEPDPSNEEHPGRVCAVPECSTVVTGRQTICPRCRGRLKKRRQRERRRQALAEADHLDAETRLSGSPTDLLDAVERDYFEFAFFKAMMEANGHRVIRRPLPHVWVGEDGKLRVAA